jgi:hypothetical protein
MGREGFIEKIKRRIKHFFGICEHKGCWKRGFECFINPSMYDEPSEAPLIFIYCHEHAEKEGFCSICGDFWGGIESFEFWHPGICDNCWDEIQSNREEPDFDFQEES